MKTRVIIFLTVSAIATLSFTFVSISTQEKNNNENAVKSTQAEPVGGLVSAEKL
jgi:hypothetical protein